MPACLAMFTKGRFPLVDGLTARVDGCQKSTLVLGPSTRPVNSGSGNRPLELDTGRVGLGWVGSGRVGSQNFRLGWVRLGRVQCQKCLIRKLS